MRRFVSMDPFCFRQFEDPLKLSFVSADKEAFVARVNEYIAANGGEACLRDGYAPFCKHIFMPNDATFTQARATTVRLVPELEPAVRTAYEARTAKELPVLVRFLPRAAMPAPGPPVATFLDVILYNRAQLDKENAAMHGAKQQQQQQQQQGEGEEGEGGESGGDGGAAAYAASAVGGSDTPWGIVSVKAQDVDVELPMNPATMLRNALGKEEGGSGVALERDTYAAAVQFWQEHVSIR